MSKKKHEPIVGYIIIAILLHLLLVSVLAINLLEKRATTYIEKPNQSMIKAHAVSSQQLAEEIQQIQREEQQRRQRILAAKRKAEAERQAKIRAAKVAEAKRKAAREAKQKAAKLAAEKKLQALRQQQALQAAKQKQAALEKKLWQQQMAREQEQLKAARARQVQGIVDQYRARVIQAIAQKWIIPDNTNPSLVTKLRIQLAPGGTVIDVILVSTSGNGALDRSAVTAVYRASPLPVPDDADAFNAFRQFELNVRPSEIQ